MPKPSPPPLSVTLTAVRRLRGWTVEELAAASGVTPGLVTQYEAGVKRIPSRERVDAFAAVMGYEPEEVGAVLFGITQVAHRPQPGPLSPVDPTPEQHRRIRAAAGRLAQAELAVMEEHFVKAVRAARARRDRSRAEDLVRWLLEEPAPRARRELVEHSASFHQWAVAERLCEESAKAAADSAEKARELSALALRAAEPSAGGTSPTISRRRPWSLPSFIVAKGGSRRSRPCRSRRSGSSMRSASTRKPRRRCGSSAKRRRRSGSPWRWRGASCGILKGRSTIRGFVSRSESAGRQGLARRALAAGVSSCTCRLDRARIRCRPPGEG